MPYVRARLFRGLGHALFGATLAFAGSLAGCKNKSCDEGEVVGIDGCEVALPQAAAGMGGSSGSGGSSGTGGSSENAGSGGMSGGAADGGPVTEQAAAAADGGAAGGAGEEGAGSRADSGADASDRAQDDCTPSAELCDAKDNDCDGDADEALTRSCGPQTRGQCRSGTETCTEGRWAGCSGALEASAETCDAELKDENCDGASNEGCACVPGEQKACPKSEGICDPGKQVCNGGTWGSCEGASAMTVEVCDGGGRDEDCDGMVNEGCECTEGETEECETGRSGACAVGVKMCAGGKWGNCVGRTGESPEVCDEAGLDEDCDGDVNEGCCEDGEMQACTTDRPGVCEAGTQRCRAGTWGGCESEVEASSETCDGMDNDCNGMPDDGQPCPNGGRCIDGRCASCTPASAMRDCPTDNPCQRGRCNAQGACESERLPNDMPCETSDGEPGSCTDGECNPMTQASENEVVCFAHAVGGADRTAPAAEVTFRFTGFAVGACAVASGELDCKDWFGLCETLPDRLQVQWRVYDDGGANPIGPTRSIQLLGPQMAVTLESPATARKWFGDPRTRDGKMIECRLLDDAGNTVGDASRDFYLNAQFQVCSDDGRCAPWLGQCRVVP